MAGVDEDLGTVDSAEIPEEACSVADLNERIKSTLESAQDRFPNYVVKEKYTEHAEILRSSVANWERDGQRFFLLKDERSVRLSEEQGATPIEETNYVVGL